MIPRLPSMTDRNGRPHRGFVGFFGLMAVLAMVLAGPSHLWLAHGGAHHEHGVEPASLSGCQGHHHACGGHGHADIQRPSDSEEDQHDSSPCDSTADDCDTCIAIGAAKPIELAETPDLGEFRFVEFTLTGDESPSHGRRPRSGVPRGPPLFA